MIAIDTNVLLRFLLQDDTKQSAKANRLIENEKKVLVTDVAIVETLWTLKGKKYNLSKENLLMVIEQLFKEPNIFFEDRQTVWRALNVLRETQSVKVGGKKKDADFSDALILEKSRYDITRKELPFDGVFTFDTAARQLAGMKKP